MQKKCDKKGCRRFRKFQVMLLSPRIMVFTSGGMFIEVSQTIFVKLCEEHTQSFIQGMISNRDYTIEEIS